MKAVIFTIALLSVSFAHACPDDLNGSYVNSKSEAETLKISQPTSSSYEFQFEDGSKSTCNTDGSKDLKETKFKSGSKFSVEVSCFCKGSILVKLTSTVMTDEKGNRVYPDTKEIVEMYTFNVWEQSLHKFYAIDAGLGITTAQGEVVFKKK